MRPIVLTTTDVGTQEPIPLDTYISAFQVSVGVQMSAGSEVLIQHTFSDIFNASITPTWYPTVSSAADEGFLLLENGGALLQESGSYLLTGDENFSHFINFPVSALRLNVLQNSGTVTMTVLQAGLPGR